MVYFSFERCSDFSFVPFWIGAREAVALTPISALGLGILCGAADKWLAPRVIVRWATVACAQLLASCYREPEIAVVLVGRTVSYEGVVDRVAIVMKIDRETLDCGCFRSWRGRS